MDQVTRIKQYTFQLINCGKNSITACADYVKRSTNYLYRISSLTEEIGLSWDLGVSLMKFQNNYDLLKQTAWECGFALVKLPKGKMLKGEENKIAAEYQKSASDAVLCLINFINDSSDENYQKIKASLREITEKSVSADRYVDKKQSKQEELGL